jgi:hypothetical protein
MLVLLVHVPVAKQLQVVVVALARWADWAIQVRSTTPNMA